MRVALTLKSSNAKTGPIPVSMTSKDTCPSACPLKGAGCYADTGPLGIHWNRLSRDSSKGMSWEQFCSAVQALPDNQLWRHNQAGDLPGDDNQIDHEALLLLVMANRGKRGFTYTHKPLTSHNLQAIQAANALGFTVNVSTNNLSEADDAVATGQPVVTLVPRDSAKSGKTAAGARWAVCPAQLSDKMTCEKCRLCQRPDRNVIVAFRSHGNRAAKVDALART